MKNKEIWGGTIQDRNESERMRTKKGRRKCKIDESEWMKIKKKMGKK